MLMEVQRLAQDGCFNQLLNESTGFRSPARAQGTHLLGWDQRGLLDGALLDTLVTVVDVSSFLRDYSLH